MHKISRNISNRFIVAITTALTLIMLLTFNGSTAQSAKIVVTWFVGLTAASTVEGHKEPQEKVVEAFNNSQDEIKLVIDFGPHGDNIHRELSQGFARGTGPDIVGPTSFHWLRYFPEQWLDLAPLAEKHHYDLSQYPKNMIDLYTENGKLIGLPFSIMPGLMYYNVDLFDTAGLNYPPTVFGEKYVLDGKQVEWNWDTVAEIGRRLTLDINGNDANNPDFDENNITQFGFVHQWDTSIRESFSTFGSTNLVNADGNIRIPEHWHEAARWLHTGVWKDRFIPDDSDKTNTFLNYNPFASGKVAMARSMLWYMGLLKDLTARWDIAVLPSYKAQVYVPVDTYTLRISKASKNPDAAFQVLEYLHGAAASELMPIYGMFPAQADLQNDFIERWTEMYPNVKNWHVVVPSIGRAVDPNPFSLVPNLLTVDERFKEFQMLVYTESGKTINLEKELGKLEADLQFIVKAFPTPTRFPY